MKGKNGRMIEKHKILVIAAQSSTVQPSLSTGRSLFLTSDPIGWWWGASQLPFVSLAPCDATHHNSIYPLASRYLTSVDSTLESNCDPFPIARTSGTGVLVQSPLVLPRSVVICVPVSSTPRFLQSLFPRLLRIVRYISKSHPIASAITSIFAQYTRCKWRLDLHQPDSLHAD